MDFNHLRRYRVELRLDLIEEHLKRMKIYVLIIWAGSLTI